MLPLQLARGPCQTLPWAADTRPCHTLPWAADMRPCHTLPWAARDGLLCCVHPLATMAGDPLDDLRRVQPRRIR